MDEKVRKKVLRMLPHGLQVVTVRSGERFHGYTSSWMTQVSFTPPLLVLGVKADSISRPMIAESKVLAIHFPAKDQIDLVKGFFKPPVHEPGTLNGHPYRVGPRTGCPILEDVLAHAECRVVHEWSGGDHDVVVVEVLDVELHRDGEPLTVAHTPWQYGG